MEILISNVLPQLGWVALGAAVMMLVLWLIHLPLRDAGLVDVGWAGGLGASAIFCALTGEGDPTARWLIGIVGALWGFRLALHLLVDRVITAKEEDGRYQMLREKLPPGWKTHVAFLFFFQVQALLVGVLALPFALASQVSHEGLGILQIFGVVVALVSVGGEALADRQLARFKKRPDSRGRTCREGLWRYSRHPNYFFEWLIWCAFALMATPAPMGWLAWLAPAFMLLLILKVTGIPPTEARSVRSRGEDYRAYQRTTSAFFPWPPKADSASGTKDRP